MMSSPARLVALLAVATASFAMSDAGRSEQLEARLPASLPNQKPATLAACNQASYDACMKQANHDCQLFSNGNAEKVTCWQERTQQCKAQNGC